MRQKLSRRHVLCCLVAVPLAAPANAFAQAAPDRAPAAIETFVRGLQTALRNNDAKWIAARIRYPARYFAGKTRAVIRSPTAFIANYRSYIGPRLREAVLAQDPEDVFNNWQGYMIGGGDPNIWAREEGEGDRARLLIVTINNSK